MINKVLRKALRFIFASNNWVKMLSTRFFMVFECFEVDKSAFADIAGIRLAEFDGMKQLVTIQCWTIWKGFAASVAFVRRAAKMKCDFMLISGLGRKFKKVLRLVSTFSVARNFPQMLHTNFGLCDFLCSMSSFFVSKILLHPAISHICLSSDRWVNMCFSSLVCNRNSALQILHLKKNLRWNQERNSYLRGARCARKCDLRYAFVEKFLLQILQSKSSSSPSSETRSYSFCTRSYVQSQMFCNLLMREKPTYNHSPLQKLFLPVVVRFLAG